MLATAWPSSAGEQEDKAYLDLVALAREDTTKVNFATMRKLYEVSSFYAAELSNPSPIPSGDWAPTNEIAIKYIDENFATLEAQTFAMRIAEPKSQVYYMHLRSINALFNAVLRAGNGLTKESAIRVFSVLEEYTVMAGLELEPKAQKAISDAGKSYDVMTVVGKANGKTKELWFDTSAFTH